MFSEKVQQFSKYTLRHFVGSVYIYIKLDVCPRPARKETKEKERDVRINKSIIRKLNFGQLRCVGAVELAEIKCRLVH